MLFTLLSLLACANTPEPLPASESEAAPPAAAAAPRAAAAPQAAFDWGSLVGLDGQPVSQEALAGKAVLFVNVASRCGYTPQYEGLQALYEKYQGDGLVIVGVPCNQFGGQEPGSAEEIQSFCKLNYGVEFPLLEKQEVNGGDRSPLYTWLIGSEAGGGQDIKWNFEKFLIDREGRVAARFPSSVTPQSAELTGAIEAAL